MTFPDPSAAVQAATASQESNVQTEQAPSQQTQESVTSQQIYELEKLGKFKFQGDEWDAKRLEKAILREKDYTKKTQEVAEQRKTFESESKYWENLHRDLRFVAGNLAKDPTLVQKFIQTYPAKFHQYLKEYLSDEGPSEQQSQQKRPGVPDIELMSRLERLEKRYNDNEVSTNEAQIKSVMQTMGSKYPDAMPDLVLSRALELTNQRTRDGQSVTLTDGDWEQIYKQIDTQGKKFLESRYGEKIKQQKTANQQARGVEAGGGIPGQAPKKMSFKEATDAAMKHFTQG